jgi:hypothetical protein
MISFVFFAMRDESLVVVERLRNERQDVGDASPCPACPIVHSDAGGVRVSRTISTAELCAAIDVIVSLDDVRDEFERNERKCAHRRDVHLSDSPKSSTVGALEESDNRNEAWRSATDHQKI